MSFKCKDCELAIVTEVNCFYHGHTYATVDCECKDHISKEERIRADERARVIDEVNSIINFIRENSFDHNLEYDSFKAIGSAIVIDLLEQLKEKSE